jgi:hypothetical protein
MNEYSLTIIGDGPEMENPKAYLAKDYKVDNQVLFRVFLTGKSLVLELNDHRYLLVPFSLGERTAL